MSRLLSSPVLSALIGAIIASTTPSGSAMATCNGDCSNNGGVSPAEIDQIISIINLCDGDPAGCGSVAQCSIADVNGDDKITAGDLTKVVGADVIGMNPDCQGVPLGTRTFTIKPKSGFSPATGFFSTGASGSEVTCPTTGSPPCTTQWYVDQPLILEAGPKDPTTGIASVRVAQDVIFGGQVIEGGPTLCIKIQAQGSSGQLDCDGGSKQDILYAVNSNGGNPASDPVVTPFNPSGAASRAGAMTLSVMAAVDNISPPLASPADCANHTFNPTSQFYFSTETVTALVNNVTSDTAVRSCTLSPNTFCNGAGTPCSPATNGTCGTFIQLSKKGVPFNCSTWTTTDSGGRLITPLFGEDTSVGDTANLLMMGDN